MQTGTVLRTGTVFLVGVGASTPPGICDTNCSPATYGVAEDGEAHPPIGGRGGQKRRVNGYPYTEDMEAGDDLRGGTDVIGL